MSIRPTTSRRARVRRGIPVIVAATLPAISGAALAHVAMPETAAPITSPDDARTRGVESLRNAITAADYKRSANGFAFVAMIGNGDHVLQVGRIISTASRNRNEMVASRGSRMGNFLDRFRKLFVPIPFYPWF